MLHTTGIDCPLLVIVTEGGLAALTAEWGADESLRCGTPKYDDGVRAAVIHHTAGSNDYSPLESAGTPLLDGVRAWLTEQV